MILDTLKNADRYVSLNPAFERAFEFLSSAALSSLAPGRTALDGDRIYVVVVKKVGSGKGGAKLETHRNYIDIQFALAGTDVIGWANAAELAGRGGGYDADGDCELFETPPRVWFEVPPGHFAVFFPEDAHAPMCGTGLLHKIVVKVAVRQ
jgi:biofilm protein TabA